MIRDAGKTMQRFTFLRAFLFQMPCLPWLLPTSKDSPFSFIEHPHRKLRRQKNFLASKVVEVQYSQVQYVMSNQIEYQWMKYRNSICDSVHYVIGFVSICDSCGLKCIRTRRFCPFFFFFFFISLAFFLILFKSICPCDTFGFLLETFAIK